MPDATGDVKKQLMDLGKRRAQDVAAATGEDVFTNAIKDGADPKNVDLMTVNTKGKKFKMCENCSTWVSGCGGEVLTG